MIYIIKVWKFLKGYVIIKISGFNINKLLNRSISSNIEIMELRSTDPRHYKCCIHISKLRQFKALADKYNCSIEILSRNIVSIILDNLRYRFVFALGVAVFMTVLYICSSLVWVIDIEGNSQISDGEIYKFCSDSDLYIGSPIKLIDGKALSENIKNTFKNISWVNFSIEGTRVYIKMAEGKEGLSEVTNSEPCNIAADKNGIISNIITDKGTPLVKKNDVVIKGDILISGNLVNSGNEEIQINDVVHSRGTIRAYVNNNYNFTVPLLQVKKIYTGNIINKYRLKLWQLDFADGNDIKFKKYDFSKSVDQLKLGEKIYLPITFFKYTYKEYETTEEIISTDKAKDLANKMVIDYIIENYPTSADILSCKIDYKKENNVLNVYANILSDEEIGIEQKISQNNQIIN